MYDVKHGVECKVKCNMQGVSQNSEFAVMHASITLPGTDSVGVDSANKGPLSCLFDASISRGSKESSDSDEFTSFRGS